MPEPLYRVITDHLTEDDAEPADLPRAACVHAEPSTFPLYPHGELRWCRSCGALWRGKWYLPTPPG